VTRWVSADTPNLIGTRQNPNLGPAVDPLSSRAHWQATTRPE
jgi:hypothetical protein